MAEQNAEQLEIKTVPVGDYQANCYIVSKGNEALVIDPGAEADKIMAAIGDKKVKLIVLTHSHFDHIGACQEVAFKTGAPIACGTFDAKRATSARTLADEKGISVKAAQDLIVDHIDKELIERDKLIVGTMQFEVYETPGHTAGGISLYGEGVVFTGDTLFKGSMGRTDFPTGDEHAILRSLYILGHLPEDTVVYPGHGPKSTIGTEKKTNQFMRFALNHPGIAENFEG